MLMSPVLSIQTIISAINCLCSSNLDGNDIGQQDGLDNLNATPRMGGSHGPSRRLMRNLDEILIDNQLVLRSKIATITEQLEQLQSLAVKEEPKKLLCDPCANVVPDTMQERYVDLGDRQVTLLCENTRLYGSGWLFVIRVTDIAKFVPVSLRDFEEGFKIDDENFFIGMDTLNQLTKSAAYEMRVQRNELIGRWEEFEIGGRYEGLYRITKLGYFVGSESLNTLTRDEQALGKSYTYAKTDLGACTLEEIGGVCNVGEYIKTQAQRAKKFMLQIRRKTDKLFN